MTCREHQCWHCLFDSLPAEAIPAMLEKWYVLFVFKPRTVASPTKIKKSWAWKALFDKMTFEEIVDSINKIWIDPDYMLVAMSPGKVKLYSLEKARLCA